MSVLAAFIFAAFVGLVVWLICLVLPFTKQYAKTIALIATVLAFLIRLGVN